jgi:hypothetical protein
VKGALVFGKIEKDSLKTLFTYKSTESNVYFQTPVWNQNRCGWRFINTTRKVENFGNMIWLPSK